MSLGTDLAKIQEHVHIARTAMDAGISFQCGISIPDDLSVVGFDDEDFATMVTPPLTTVRVQMAEIGRQAVRQLMIHIQGGSVNRAAGCRIRLVADLVVRQSTASAPLCSARMQ